MADDTRLRATMMRDNKANPWSPYFLPSERYEVRFADIKGYAAFTTPTGNVGKENQRRLSEWCEQTVAGKWSLGMEAAFFDNEDDAMLCKITFS